MTRAVVTAAEAELPESVGALRVGTGEQRPSSPDVAFFAELFNAREPWQKDAACIEHPEVNFFPARGEAIEPAKRVCAQCLVREECLAYALARPWLSGVWGGTAWSVRSELRVRTGAATAEAYDGKANSTAALRARARENMPTDDRHRGLYATRVERAAKVYLDVLQNGGDRTEATRAVARDMGKTTVKAVAYLELARERGLIPATPPAPWRTSDDEKPMAAPPIRSVAVVRATGAPTVRLHLPGRRRRR